MSEISWFSAFAELNEEGRLRVVPDVDHPLRYATKLKTSGEYQLLLTVDGNLFIGEHHVREKSIQFVLLRSDVSDFDTEGNWIYVVDRAEGKVFQGKNDSIGEWTPLFEECNEKFNHICCNNNGLLLTTSVSGQLCAMGDFGNVFQHEALAPVKETSNMTVVQMSAGIDFVVLCHRNRSKTQDSRSPSIAEKKQIGCMDWRNIYEDRQFGKPSAGYDESGSAFGRMIHETGVASFGKVNKGQLGTGDHIRRDKIVHLKLNNVAKLVTGCVHSAALTVEGSLYLWGDSEINQATPAPDSSSASSLTSGSTPSMFGKSKQMLDVACANFQTCVVTNDLQICDIRSDEARMNYECADRKRFGEMLDGLNLDDVPLVLTSHSLVIVNHMPINKEGLKIYSKEQQTVQKLLKQNFLAKKLGQEPSLRVFYKACAQMFYLYLVNLKALKKFLFENDLTKIVSLLLHDEYLHLYRIVVKSFCDSECLGLIGEQEETLLQTFLENVKNSIELIEILVNGNKNLNEEIETRLLNIKSDWLKFTNEEVPEQMGKLMKMTKDFWCKDDNLRWFSLKQADRRVVLDSVQVPLKLLEVNLFSSSPRFVLFSDVLTYLSGINLIIYPLRLIWISTAVRTVLKNRDKDKLRFIVNIITPEEVIHCYTLNSSDKLVWMNSLKTHIMRNLEKDPTEKQSMYRWEKYKFSAKHPKFSDMEYTGIWKMGQVDGIGELRSTERTYKGELYRGDITGYGCMNRTQCGIGTIYEGDFIQGKYEGYGKLKSISWHTSHYFKYRGYFRGDKYNGFGALTTSSYQYNGDFVNDAKEGFGVVDDTLNGIKYIGMFTNDRKHGSGILITTNGTYYAGLFSNDMLVSSADGLAIFPNGTYYQGELTIDGPCGKGIFYYPEKEMPSETFELDDRNVKMSGHTLSGSFSGTWETVKVSNGSMTMYAQFNKVPILDLKINAERKWASIFNCFHISLFGTCDIGTIRNMDVKKIWNRIAVHINRAKRKDQLKTNKFETRFAELDDQSAERICLSGYRMTNYSTASLRSSISDSRLTLNSNPNEPSSVTPSDSMVALDNLSIRSFNSFMSRENDDDFLLNTGGPNDRSSPSRDLDIVPDFCVNTMERKDLEQLREYLELAFQNSFHPLHQLYEKLSNCFYSTYSCWKFTPHSILSEPAMNEWISIVSRIYTLVLTVMFPALPKDSIVIDDELLSYQSLLFPILMTQGIYSALFVLYASKCSKNDEIYRQRILICEKKTDENLIQLLDINRNLAPVIISQKYQKAIESLNRFKEKCCPSEMMKHISEAFCMVDQASKEHAPKMDITADSLVELTILLIIKANIPQLGAEISLLEDLLQNDQFVGGYRWNTQQDYCLTTLKASYQHIISDNFFVNKMFEASSP
ncbi:alsin homolog [Uranotaenia lowii]|uniref:alsin homolog n=1 Tax=Uranotaenia lowii TaxID=190385 RepID=UPI0024786556|nr:alsin homolog [Uranotaenia lowii]